jgi:hypothetical protein
VRRTNRALLCGEEDVEEHVSLFPEEQFLKHCETLGFNRNTAIVSLMPLIAHVRRGVL